MAVISAVTSYSFSMHLLLLEKERKTILDISRDMTLDNNQEIKVSMFYGDPF